MRRILFPVFCAATLMAACDDDATTPVGDADVTGTPDGTTQADGTSTPDATTTPDATATPDATTPDATPDATRPPDATTTAETEVANPDEGSGICGGILACVVECTTQECFQNCIGNADSQDEASYFNGYLGCLQDNKCLPEVADPTDEQVIASIECEQEKCLGANVECATGATYGAGTCSGIFTCLNGCPSNTDVLCQRECFSAATEASATAWYDLNYCLNIECYTSDDFSTCAQTAIQAPPCSLKYNACTGGAGAGAGAGGGGSFSPKQRQAMGEFFKQMRAQ